MYITKIQALKFVTSLESSIIAQDETSGETADCDGDDNTRCFFTYFLPAALSRLSRMVRILFSSK